MQAVRMAEMATLSDVSSVQRFSQIAFETTEVVRCPLSPPPAWGGVAGEGGHHALWGAPTAALPMHPVQRSWFFSGSRRGTWGGVGVHAVHSPCVCLCVRRRHLVALIAPHSRSGCSRRHCNNRGMLASHAHSTAAGRRLFPGTVVCPLNARLLASIPLGWWWGVPLGAGGCEGGHRRARRLH
jgi:hypothetical protein